MNIHGFNVLSTLEERVDPQHSAVLVIDMQNDYCSPGGATEANGRDISTGQAIVPNIARVVNAARAAGLPIFWARYTVGPDTAGWSGPEILRRGRIFAEVKATIKGTWGHEIMAELPYRSDVDVVIDKRRPSAFVATDLDLQLRSRGIKTLVVTGVVTQGCVESTVRDAVGLDYYVAVVADCCASSGPGEHQLGIQSMTNHLQYSEGVTSTERLCAIFGEAAPAVRTAGRIKDAVR